MKYLLIVLFLTICQVGKSQIGVFIDFNTNQEDSVWYLDHPIIIEVMVADIEGVESEYQNSFNNAIKEELNEEFNRGMISDSLYQIKIKELKNDTIKTIRISPPFNPWYENLIWQHRSDTTWIDWDTPIQILDSPISDSASIIGGGQSSTIWFGLDPEVTSKYIVDELLEIRVGYYHKEEMVWSNSIKIIFKNSIGIEDNSLYFAEYWFRRGQVELALNLVNEIIISDPKSTTAHALLGDIYSSQGQIEDALESYLTALENFFIEFPDEYEDPVPLRLKIYELQQILID